jgi:hypothetical protein
MFIPGELGLDTNRYNSLQQLLQQLLDPNFL